MPRFAWADDPPRSAKRIQDADDPYKTTPLPAAHAVFVDKLERTTERIEQDQEKLKTGQIKQEEYDKALVDNKKQVAEIAATLPKSAPVQTSAARAYIQAGDYGLAVTHASKAMELAPNDPFPVTTRGLAYYNSRDFPRAAADAKRALALDPKDPVAKAIYELSKDRVPGDGGTSLQNALSRAGREVASLPQNPYLAGALDAASGGGLRPDDDPEIARYPSEQGRRFARRMIAAENAMKRKDFVTAYGLANEALTTFADNPRMLAARAASAWNLGEYRTTIADATKVMQALSDGHPMWHPMLVARAAASSELGRHADALRDAQKATSLFPRSGRAYLERAIAKEGLRDAPESVVADFRRAAELDVRFTSDYERALARLMPAGPATHALASAKEAAPSAESAAAAPVVALLARHGVQVTPSDVNFALGALAIVGLFAVAAFALSRRG